MTNFSFVTSQILAAPKGPHIETVTGAKPAFAQRPTAEMATREQIVSNPEGVQF
jgi:hypothetical protein